MRGQSLRRIPVWRKPVSLRVTTASAKYTTACKRPVAASEAISLRNNTSADAGDNVAWLS